MPPRRKSNRRVILPGAARFAPPAAAAVPPPHVPQPLATNADAQSAAAPSIIPPPAAATPEVTAAVPITPAVTTTATTPVNTTVTPTTTTASAAVEATVKRTFFTGLSPSDAPQPAAAVKVPPTAAPTPTPTPTPAVAAEPTVAAAAASRSLAARRRASRKRATRGKAVPPTAAAHPMVFATVPDAQPVVDTTAANAPTPAAATSKVFFEALEKQTELLPAAAAPLVEAAVSDVPAAPQDTPNMAMEPAPPVAPAVPIEEVAAPAAPRPRAMGLTQFRKLQKRKRTAKVDLPVVEQPTEAVPPPTPAAQEVQQAEVAACDEAPSAPAQAEAVSQPPPPPPITASVNVVPEPIPAAPIAAPLIDAPMEPAAAAPDAAPARPQRMMSYTTYMKKQQAKNRRMKAAAARTRRKEAVVAKKLAQERAKEAARVAQAAAEEAMAKAEEARAQAELAAAAITAAAEAEAAKIKAAAEVAAAAELAKARQASQEILATSAPTPAAAAVEAVPPTTAEVPLQSPAKAYGRRKRRVFISTPLVPAPPPLAVPEAGPFTTIAAEKVEEVLTPAEGQHEAPRAELPVIPDYDENITCVDMPTSVPAPPAVGTRAMMNADRLKRNKKKFFAALEDSEATASAAAEAVEAPVKVAVEEPTQMEAAPSYEEKTLPSEEPEPQQQPAAAVAEAEAEVDMEVEAAEDVAPAVEPIASAEQQPTAVETEPSAQVEEAEPSTAAEEVAIHESPTAVAGSPAIDPVFRGRMSSAKFKKLRLLRQQQRRAAMAEAAAATTTTTASYDAEAENVPKHHAVEELVIDSETLQAAPDTLEAEDAKAMVEAAADNGDVAQPLEDVVPHDEPEVTPQTQAAAEAVEEVASAPLEEPAAPAPIAEVARTHTISHRGRKKKSFTQLVAQKAAAADESVAQVEEAAAMGTEVEVEVEAVRPVVEAEQAEAVAAELPMANEQLPSEALPNVEEPVMAPPQTEAVLAPHVTVNTHTVPEVEEIVPTPVAARSVPEEDRLRRRLSAKKRIKRHSKLAEARREKREAPHNAAADEAAPVLEVPLVPELNAAPPLVEPASETSAETLVRTAALTFPSGFVQVESFTDTELVLLRDNLDRSWDVGLRFDWNMRTLALTLPAFPAADPRQQHPYMQLFRSKPSWFLKEVNGADASQMREVMDSMKKTLRSRFVFKRV